MTSTDAAPNDMQAAYWSSDAGAKWVRHQAGMDTSLSEVAALLMRHAAVGAGERVIDVGCGTGATLLELAPRTGPTGRVLGCDVSAPMLDLARRRIAEAGHAHVEIVEADAQTHAFEAGAHDLVISRFGVMFFADSVAAFANLRRALRPDGRLAFACWAPPADNPFFTIQQQVAVARLGPVEPPPPGAPGPFAFSDPDLVRAILRDAGFADIEIHDGRPHMIGAATPEAQAAFNVEMGPAARVIQEKDASAADIAAIREGIATAFAAFVSDGRVRIPSRQHYVRARNPG
ncbi:MAG: class I SAM-dependent methyltransferase [Alphaproteobacteria bacterium]